MKWYLTNRNSYSIEDVAEYRWAEITKSEFELDIFEFIAALGMSIDFSDINQHHTEQFERQLREESKSRVKSPKSIVENFAWLTEADQEKLGPLKQILESSAKTPGSPLYSYPEGMPADRVAEYGEPEEQRSVAIGQEVPVPNLSVQARDRDETYLFIITRDGKPEGITPESVETTELDIDEVLDRSTLSKETLTAYPAPDTQRPALEQMFENDIILIFDGEGTYDAEYRISDVVTAPDTIASIWPKSVDKEPGSTEHPHLILMDSYRPRSIPQPALNSLLGYDLSAVPTRWKVAEDRVRDITDAGQSIETILDGLDQS